MYNLLVIESMSNVNIAFCAECRIIWELDSELDSDSARESGPGAQSNGCRPAVLGCSSQRDNGTFLAIWAVAGMHCLGFSDKIASPAAQRPWRHGLAAPATQARDAGLLRRGTVPGSGRHGPT